MLDDAQPNPDPDFDPDAWPPGTPWYVRRRMFLAVGGAGLVLLLALGLAREWGWVGGA